MGWESVLELRCEQCRSTLAAFQIRFSSAECQSGPTWIEEGQKGCRGQGEYRDREAVSLFPGRRRSIASLLNPSFREVRFFVPRMCREGIGNVPGSAFFRSGNVPGSSFFASGKEPVDYFLTKSFIPGSSFFRSGNIPGSSFFVPGAVRERSGCILRVGRGPRQVSGRRRTDGGEWETGGCFFWWRKDVACCNIHFHFPS